MCTQWVCLHNTLKFIEFEDCERKKQTTEWKSWKRFSIIRLLYYIRVVPIYLYIIFMYIVKFFSLLIQYIPMYYSKPLPKPPRVRRAHNVCVQYSWSKKVTPKVKPCARMLMSLNDARERIRRARPAASRMTCTRYKIFSSVQVHVPILYTLLAYTYLSVSA